MKILANFIRNYLKIKGIAFSQFAEMLGLDEKTLSSVIDNNEPLDYKTAKNFIYQLGAYEAIKLIDWEGMKIERPAI